MRPMTSRVLESGPFAGKRLDVLWEEFLSDGLYRMKPSVKAMWVEALRSEEYEHASGRLVTRKKGDGAPAFSVLGILCDCYVNSSGAKGTYWAHRGLKPAWNEPVEKYVLPALVSTWAGLDFKWAGWNPDPTVAISARVNTEFGKAESIGQIDDWAGWGLLRMSNFIQSHL
jgi:hypothetical protein